jgi:hypothetical protein
MPLAPEQGPSFAPPENWQTPFGVLHDGSVRVKDRPYYGDTHDIISKTTLSERS